MNTQRMGSPVLSHGRKNSGRGVCTYLIRESAGNSHRGRPMRLGAVCLVIAGLLSLLLAGSANAAVSDPWTNPSFETGNLTAWSTSGQVVKDPTTGIQPPPVSALKVYAK